MLFAALLPLACCYTFICTCEYVVPVPVHHESHSEIYSASHALIPRVYSNSTLAPSSFSVATIFSASSFGTESFISLGALSTNFLESTKLSPSRFLISLMTLGFAAASKDTSFTENRVFSCAAGASSSGSDAAGAAAAGAAAANPPTGKSGMLSRDCSSVAPGQLLLLATAHRISARKVRCGPRPTFRLETRSAVSSSVNWLIWSTMPAILGFVGAAAAAASVDWYRLAILCWASAPAEILRVGVERSWRAQHRAAYLQESDMVKGCCE